MSGSGVRDHVSLCVRHYVRVYLLELDVENEVNEVPCADAARALMSA